jgi:methylenetetrahydrofolate reductase (NADPH)
MKLDLEPSSALDDRFGSGPPGLIARAGASQVLAPRVSFEVFPPKTPDAASSLWTCIRRLEPLAPAFVSVTYGANGSTREPTRAVLRELITQTAIPAAAHLTCVGGSRAEVDEIISGYQELGVRHIVALRGDPEGGIGGAYTADPAGYANATELTAAIRRIGDFEVSVACYPEKHPESPSLAHDIEVLKAKVGAGATRAVSQFFFDLDAFLRFVDRARRAGVGIPIVPGVMPVTNFAGLRRMAAACGAAVPAWLARHFDGLDADPETRRLIACSIAAEMCARLQAEGFAEFHIYTLNRPELAYAVCRVLGLREEAPRPELAQ